MILEAIILVYALGIVLFFAAMIRDRYVVLNYSVLLVYFIASLVWPLSGLLYILDNRGN